MHTLEQTVRVLIQGRGTRAPYLFKRRADVKQPLCAEVEHPKDLIDIFRELPEPFFALQIRDVNVGAYITSEYTSGREARDPTAQDQPVLSIPTAQPALQLEVPAGVERRAEYFIAALEVIGMHAGGPAVSQFLLRCAAGKVQPSLIDKREELVRTCDPDHYRRCVGHLPEAFFAFPQRGLGALALGDIVKRSNQMRTSLLVVKYRYNADFAGQPPGRVITSLFPRHDGVFFYRLPVLPQYRRQGRFWDNLIDCLANHGFSAQSGDPQKSSVY